MDRIESKNNDFLKEVKKLKEKKYRIKKQCFLVEGIRFVIEALDSKFFIEALVVSDKFLKGFYELEIDFLNLKNTRIVSVSDDIFNGLCDTENPQGILAVVKNKDLKVLGERGFYILADKLQDPGNMGTIIRTAHAAGALAVIITKGTVDIYNEKTLRSTMGSIFRMPIIEDKDLEVVKNLQDKGFKLVTSTLDTDKNFFEVDLNQDIIISVGNEGNGISNELRELSDIEVKIPMPGNAESLNAAVAASIMMYEVVRQNI
ncbi:MAG: RNA methyltransferase [Clostridium sp.]